MMSGWGIGCRDMWYWYSIIYMHVVATNIVRYILMDFPNAMIVAGYYYSGFWVQITLQLL